MLRVLVVATVTTKVSVGFIAMHAKATGRATNAKTGYINGATTLERERECIEKDLSSSSHRKSSSLNQNSYWPIFALERIFCRSSVYCKVRRSSGRTSSARREALCRIDRTEDAPGSTARPATRRPFSLSFTHFCQVSLRKFLSLAPSMAAPGDGTTKTPGRFRLSKAVTAACANSGSSRRSDCQSDGRLWTGDSCRQLRAVPEEDSVLDAIHNKETTVRCQPAKVA